MNRLILYSTSHCHLCEQALVMLNAAIASPSTVTNFTYEVIDIIDNDQHMESHALLIPVIYNPVTHETLNWPFSKEMIMDLLHPNKSTK